MLKKKVEKKDWEKVMEVVQTEGPNKGRPRRLSIHTITALCGRDGFEILKEMEESGKVVGYECPDVRTPIYYLLEKSKLPGMIDSRNANCWEKGRAWLKRYPTKDVKGFKRFPFMRFNAKGKYGAGFENDPEHKHKPHEGPTPTYGCPDACYPMDVPFAPEDAAYEKLVRKALAR
jgi:hypothetical protein